MPANTPIYGFPYPIGTDPVAQGDNVIQQLAEGVENRISTFGGAWITWTPQLWSGAGQASTSLAIGRYTLINKTAILHVALQANGTGAAGAVECRNIPTAIAPKRTGSTNNGNGAEIGTGGFIDSGTAYYVGHSYFFSSTAIRLLTSPNGVDLALTIASGDRYLITMTYEIN